MCDVHSNAIVAEKQPTRSIPSRDGDSQDRRPLVIGILDNLVDALEAVLALTTRTAARAFQHLVVDTRPLPVELREPSNGCIGELRCEWVGDESTISLATPAAEDQPGCCTTEVTVGLWIELIDLPLPFPIPNMGPLDLRGLRFLR